MVKALDEECKKQRSVLHSLNMVHARLEGRCELASKIFFKIPMFFKRFKNKWTQGRRELNPISTNRWGLMVATNP